MSEVRTGDRTYALRTVLAEFIVASPEILRRRDGISFTTETLKLCRLEYRPCLKQAQPFRGRLEEGAGRSARPSTVTLKPHQKRAGFSGLQVLRQVVSSLSSSTIPNLSKVPADTVSGIKLSAKSHFIACALQFT
jgi:hypothetical protein